MADDSIRLRALRGQELQTSINNKEQQASDAEQSGAQTTPPLPTPPLSANEHNGAMQRDQTNQSTHKSEDLTSHEEGNDATSSADAKPDSCSCVMFCIKFVVYLLKIVLIISQLWQFGNQRSEIVDFFDRTDKTLDHLLLKGWDASYETMPYPPATGEFAVYTVNDLLDHVQYTWEQYYSLSHISLASINPLINNSTGQPMPIRLCNSFNNYMDFHNGSYMVMPGLESYCIDLDPLGGQDKYDIRTFLRHRNLTITFPKLVKMTMDFSFTTFHLNMINTHWGPTCYKLNATIRYSNYKRSGQLQISLITHNRERTCTGRIMSQQAEGVSTFLISSVC
ncbi:mucolipin-3-like [Littorina saxatilis]|uniref:mucolipin-3-like n=1 Tax=Littorina saxatilis TaxID=31220 RepID=UPI0038B5B09A